jgi:hypothetical protein
MIAAATALTDFPLWGLEFPDERRVDVGRCGAVAAAAVVGGGSELRA